MVDAFATTQQLEAGWRPLTDTERHRAKKLLDDAAVIIRAEFPRGYDFADLELIDALGVVSCNMVRRALATPLTSAPVSSTQVTAGPYQETLTYANPAGDMYLTGTDRKMLRLGTSRIGSIQAHIGGGT